MKTPATGPAWTTPADVLTRLRRRWDRGDYLRARALGESFTPIDMAIRGPRPGELGERYDEVAAWARAWHDAARSPHLQVTTRTVGGKKFGVTTLPDRVVVDTVDHLARLLRTTDEITRHDGMLSAVADRPALHDWVATKPARALAHADDWPLIVAALRWIASNAGSGRRLREIDEPGVDTKFIETHQRILLELGALVVEPDLVTPSAKSIAGRFGFATGHLRVRFRLLDAQCRTPTPGFDDIEVRAEDLARSGLDVEQVIVVENLATYLSFPATPRSALIFGGGYAASVIGSLRWLRDREVLYWGDLDTHGFAILDRVRVTVPHARSILMDRATLLAHRERWVTEPSQVDRPLPHLTDDEASVYRDLVEDAFGPSVRLEQERIPMAVVADAVMN